MSFEEWLDKYTDENGAPYARDSELKDAFEAGRKSYEEDRTCGLFIYPFTENNMCIMKVKDHNPSFLHKDALGRIFKAEGYLRPSQEEEE